MTAPEIPFSGAFFRLRHAESARVLPISLIRPTLLRSRSMTQINPFASSILQSPVVQRQQAAEKDRQVRKAQDAEKNAALAGDRLEHQVESAEQLAAIHDEDSPDPRKRKRQSAQSRRSARDDSSDQSHLDLTA
jgi:predicted lipid-binding transport protein (Tim44 family)